MPQPFRLRVLTFNIWSLPIALPGTELYLRSTLLPTALIDLDADLIALQEAFHSRVRRRLVASLSQTHSCQSVALSTRQALGLITFDTSGGLLSFSRYPIVEQRFATLDLTQDARFTEKLARKGVLLFVLETKIGRIAFLNLHLHAGPELRSVRARKGQYRALNSIIAELPSGLPVIVAGDFNAFAAHTNNRKGSVVPSPEIQPMIDAGFVDSSRMSDDGSVRATYAVGENKYIRSWYHGSDADQRFDYIFYRSTEELEIRVQHTTIVCDDAERPLSDHYGVLSEFSFLSRQV